MDISGFIKKEFSGWGKIERIVSPAELVLIILISLYMNDSKIALISAICGICYTIFAGKGKISCYIFGLAGTLCYSYIAFKNCFWGNLVLYMLYYFPMQIWGIFSWKSHLKKESQEIYKTKLSKKDFLLYTFGSIILIWIFAIVLARFKDLNPVMDSVTTILSIVGMLLTVKRCVEQWYIWAIVNALSMIMWINAYMHGSNCFATIIMWATYLILSFYFLHNWKEETKNFV